MGFWVVDFRYLFSRFRFWDSDFGFQGSSFGVRVPGNEIEMRVEGLGFRILGQVHFGAVVNTASLLSS